MEQTAAAAWVKGQGRDRIADYFGGENLLQVPVQVAGVTMTWTACWRLWGEKLAVTYDLVSNKGRLDLRDINVMQGALSEMGSAHKACGSMVTLWARLWVDHMWGIARECGTLSAFSAFRGEGRHQSLKSEIKKRSFTGGSKKRWSRLRGTRRALRKGGAEVLWNDNPDWGLYARGFNVWQPSWTRQEAYGNAQQCWERVMRKGKLQGFSHVCLTMLQFYCAYCGGLVVEYHMDMCY